MGVSVRALAVALAFLSSLAPAQRPVKQSDQAVAERVLGPRWQQVSRRAGMIFAGTVLSAAGAPDRAAVGPTPSLELIFRVDEPIAGVERGQILTIHEWTGAWSMHRPMNRGQRILLFLYPPSRLGLTSPVGGSLGQIALDSTGKIISPDLVRNAAPVNSVDEFSSRQQSFPDAASVTVIQLKRAILAARNKDGSKEE
jgi:hypothetical protein